MFFIETTPAPPLALLAYHLGAVLADRTGDNHLRNFLIRYAIDAREVTLCAGVMYHVAHKRRRTSCLNVQGR